MSRVTWRSEGCHNTRLQCEGGHGVVYFIIYLHYAVANTDSRGHTGVSQLLVFVSVFGQQQCGYPS